jgi:BirA family transcriptional regulator, biotin operon repressor / biotin---[acetyl-CoA-carboxylase] ligase
LPGSYTNNTIGQPLIEIDATASTNNYAMELVHKGLAQHGLAIFAWEQTAGKGQRGKQWHSAKGENIILTVILNTSGLRIAELFLLSMTAAVSVHDFFSMYAGDESSVKWPNDLYWRDRKAGGILIENIITGNEWQWAVAGMGININQTNFEEHIGNAVSLKQITGKQFNPVALAKELCAHFHKRYAQLLKGDGHIIAEAYNNILYKRDEKVTLKKNNAVFDCTLKGVNTYGQLITTSATEQLFEVGEVQWII